MLLRIIQWALLALGIIGLIALLSEIGLSLAATTHSSTPARVVYTAAGPYPLKISLYTDPARAGFALPFAIAPQQPIQGKLSYDVSSIPDTIVAATPVHSSLSPDPQVPNGIQGAAEITVQGDWQLSITVNGPAGPAKVEVPITATAPPAVPQWLGWLVGFIPLYGLLTFLIVQRRSSAKDRKSVV